MIKKIIFLICSSLVVLTGYSQKFLHRQGKSFADANGKTIMLRGINLGGWLVPEGYIMRSVPKADSQTEIRNAIRDLVGTEVADMFYERYYRNYVKEEDIRQIAEWGMNHIRVPLQYTQFSEPLHPEKPVALGYEKIDQLLAWCKKYKIYLIIDLHTTPGSQNHAGTSDSDGAPRLWLEEKNRIETIKIWQNIARKYSKEEWMGGYDLLNEPYMAPGTTATDLRNFYIATTKAIREVDKNHIVFVEGNQWASDTAGLTPLWDENMAISFHDYWKLVDGKYFAQWLKLRDDFNVPLWVGETGENSNQWFYEEKEQCEKNQVSWCWWCHKKINSLSAPISAPIGPAYKLVTEYWQGKSNRPTIEEAERGLFELADNVAIENCLYRRDVIASLFDKDYGTKSKAFTYHPIPGKICAVDYDLGTNGIAYLDSSINMLNGSLTNLGRKYRNDAVDIEVCNDPQGGAYDVCKTQNEEWMNYSVKVIRKDSLGVEMRVANDGKERGAIQLLLDGNAITPILEVPRTQGKQNWETVRFEKIPFENIGDHLLKVRIVKGGFSINTIEFYDLKSSKR